MRYYRIVISDPKSGNVITPPGFDGLLGGASYTSYVNGQTLPAAWNVLLDVPVIDAATPQGAALATIWGVSIAEIGQANDLNGKNVAIYGGMQKGLPLANPAQSGLLVQGFIFQAFGNWIGTDMTLDLVILPGQATTSTAGGFGTLAKPKNIVLDWKAGTPLGDALKNTLSAAFPGTTATINVDPSIVRKNDETTYYPTLEQLAQYVRETSFDVIKTQGYAGVSIVPSGTSFNVFDGSQAASGSPKMLAFQDLIGQPTWIEAPNISVKTVMRADLSVGDSIMLPPALTTNTQQASSSLVNQKAAFAGGFRIISLRHVGNYRQPSADSWVTVIEAAPINQQAANG